MRRRSAPVLLALAACVLAGFPSGARAQGPCLHDPGLGVVPVVLRTPDGGWSGGAGIRGGLCRREHDPGADFPRTRFVEADVDLLVPFTSTPLSRGNLLGVSGGWAITLARRRPLDPEADPDREGEGLYRFHHGFLGLGGRIHHRSDARLRSHAVSAGADVRWVDPARPLLPSLVLSVDAVQRLGGPAEPEARGGLRDEVRGKVRAWWLFFLPAALEVEVDAGYSRSRSIGDIPTSHTRTRHLATELAWRRPHSRGDASPFGPIRIDRLFVEHARGLQPAGTVDEPRWTFGMEIGPGR